MVAVKGTAVHNVAAARTLIVVLAILLAVHWRIALKIALFILAATVIALLGTGAFALLHHPQDGAG
jgi:hypothetical protein